MRTDINIRKAIKKDHDRIWEIIRLVISKGDTNEFSPDSSKEKMLAYWCAPAKHLPRLSLIR